MMAGADGFKGEVSMKEEVKEGVNTLVLIIEEKVGLVERTYRDLWKAVKEENLEDVAFFTRAIECTAEMLTKCARTLSTFLELKHGKKDC